MIKGESNESTNKTRSSMMLGLVTPPLTGMLRMRIVRFAFRKMAEVVPLVKNENERGGAYGGISFRHAGHRSEDGGDPYADVPRRKPIGLSAFQQC